MTLIARQFVDDADEVFRMLSDQPTDLPMERQALRNGLYHLLDLLYSLNMDTSSNAYYDVIFPLIEALHSPGYTEVHINPNWDRTYFIHQSRPVHTLPVRRPSVPLRARFRHLLIDQEGHYMDDHLRQATIEYYAGHRVT